MAAAAASSSSPISSAYSSRSSLASLRSTNARPRSIRRGQIKAAIFASIFTSIARLVGLQAAEEGEHGAHSSPRVSGSLMLVSNLRVDVDGGQTADNQDSGGLRVSVDSVRSSSASISSGAHTPDSSPDLSSPERPGSFVDGSQKMA